MDRKQVASILKNTPQMLRMLLAGIDPALCTWRPKPDEWSINEIIGHLIDGDRYAFADRIQVMLDQDAPEIPAVDVNALAAQRNDNEREVYALLDELAAQREEHTRFLLALNNDDLVRTGKYKKYGMFRVSDFVYEWAYHDASHTQQILENLKAATWPRFSDAMRSALED